jgi:NADH-quinone oxidoreductase subunit J
VNIIVYSGAIMILFIYHHVMNLNKENEVHKPRITRLGAIVSFFFACLFSTVGFLIKTNNCEYISTGEDYQSIKVLGKSTNEH